MQTRVQSMLDFLTKIDFPANVSNAMSFFRKMVYLFVDQE